MSRNLSCGIHCGRALLLIFNIIFILVGLALVGFGVAAKVDNNFASILDQLTDETNFEAQSLGFLAFAMIGGGVFTLLIALFGCAGKFHVRRIHHTISI
jgi:ABC-type sulfate transport system permease component